MAQNKQQAQWACIKEAQFYAQDVALSSDAPVKQQPPAAKASGYFNLCL